MLENKLMNLYQVSQFRVIDASATCKKLNHESNMLLLHANNHFWFPMRKSLNILHS